MIYFFINILMYFIINVMLSLYFRDKLNIYTFLILLFNMNISFFFLYKDLNFMYFLFLSIISILLYQIILLFRKKNQEIILIKNGNLNFHEIINYYSLNKLMLYLKIRRIRLDEIEYCLLKGSHIIIIKNNFIKHYPISIIIDGILQRDNLNLIKKDQEWLKRELLNNHLLIKMVDYAYYKDNKIYFMAK